MNDLLPVVDALCLRGLLRSRPADGADVRPAWVPLGRGDLQALTYWWALSPAVERLATRVVGRPRELPEVTVYEESVSYGHVSGALNARTTVIEQDLRQDPCVFVVDEVQSSRRSGPAHVVAWVLHEAAEAIRATVRRAGPLVDASRAAERHRIVEQALRVHAVRDVLAAPFGRSRPASGAIRETRKSRAPLCRLAVEAFAVLEDLRALREATIRRVLAESLLPQMEPWRRFELACAISVGEALAKAVGASPRLTSNLSSDEPLVRAGAFTVHWQAHIHRREEQDLDLGERKALGVTRSLGVREGAARADVLVCADDEPVALVECKWFESPSSRSGAIVEAASQIVGYARDAGRGDEATADRILARSIIAIPSRDDVPERVDLTGPVGCIDLGGVQAGQLAAWASAVCADLALPTVA